MTRQGRPATPPCQPPSPAAPPGTSGHRAESPGGVRAPRSPLPLFRPLGPAPRSPTTREQSWHMLRGKRAGGRDAVWHDSVTADHVGGCGLARRLPLKGGTAVTCEDTSPPPPALLGKEKTTSPCCFLEERHVKKGFPSAAPGRFIMEKSVPLSPPVTSLAPGKPAPWGPSTAHTGAHTRSPVQVSDRLLLNL